MPLTKRDRGQTSIPSEEGVARVSTPLSRDKATSVDLDKLCPHETIWPRKQPFLASKGYHLRPRFQPEWTPSWIQNPTLDRENCPDYVELPFRPGQIDATTTEGRLVYLKQVSTDSEELRITRMLSSPPLRDDPQNHSVPILDVFPDNEDASLSYIVMPFLHQIDKPEFRWVGEIVDFVDQILEGLAFMHRHEVAHRDCSNRNIMMEATSLFPKGFHPVLTKWLPDLTGRSNPHTRLDAPHPIRYYFIDFGLSSLIPAGTSRLVLGVFSQDKEVPELSMVTPYDAFKVDIFILGNVLRRCVHDKFFRVEFLAPLIHEMTHPDPSARPDAEVVLARWKRIRAQVCALHLICRLRARNESVLKAFTFDILALIKLSYMLAKRLARWSVAWLRVLFSL